MRRSVPIRRVAALGAIIATIGVGVSLVSDVGADLPWIVAAGTIGLAGGVLVLRGRDPLYVEILFGVALAAVAFFVTRELTRDEPDSQPTAETRVADFFVYRGEEDPEEVGSTFDEPTRALQRVEPSQEAPMSPDEVPPIVGTHIDVECRVPGSTEPTQDASRYDYRRLIWYRLTNGNFMHSGVIRQSPHSGPPPRVCS
jgi:hypothetical protein